MKVLLVYTTEIVMGCHMQSLDIDVHILLKVNIHHMI